MRVLAMYLPQYHAIEENNKWWGNGYTEWSAVKSAKPVFRGHIQPKVPLNRNYYDLSDESAKTWKWQAELARKYGVYGFCIYHYWFEGKMLLQKPMEILRHHEEIPINYCICWANESWTRTWYGLEREILMQQGYGNREDWDSHFYYLLDFFNDPRYIKIDNKPVINIYHTTDIGCLKEMRARWDELAKANGFDGVFIISGNTAAALETRLDLIDAFYNFEPGYSVGHRLGKVSRARIQITTVMRQYINKIFRTKLLERKYRIDDIYNVNIKSKYHTDEKPVFYGSFMSWDNTPRRQYKGSVYFGSSPDNFKRNLEKIANRINPDDFVYINAWNEWGEGAYLEPDEENGFGYLEAIREVTEKTHSEA